LGDKNEERKRGREQKRGERLGGARPPRGKGHDWLCPLQKGKIFVVVSKKGGREGSPFFDRGGKKATKRGTGSDWVFTGKFHCLSGKGKIEKKKTKRPRRRRKRGSLAL